MMPLSFVLFVMIIFFSETGIVPLHQYYEAVGENHLYTTNPNEIGTTTIGEIGNYGYVYEGIACYVFGENSTHNTPFYRYYNAALKNTFYTTNPNDIGTTTRGQRGEYGYVSEGITGYVAFAAIANTTTANTVPLYRYHKVTGEDNFYTTNPGIIGTTVVGEVGNYGYRYEGEACYCYSSSNPFPTNNPTPSPTELSFPKANKFETTSCITEPICSLVQTNFVDRATIFDEINIKAPNTENAIFSSMELFTSGTHTYQGDLEMRLVSPNGIELILASNVGQSNNDFDIVFSDEGFPLNSSHNLISIYPRIPQGGRFFEAFGNKSINGVWTMEIYDMFSNDTGVWEEWCFTQLCWKTM